MKLRKIIKVAIDSPSAAGAGSISRKIAKHYNLIYCDTGKIYRFVGMLKLQNPKKFNYSFVKKKVKNLKIKKLNFQSIWAHN